MKTFQWAVIGAGPAGMAALGRLIDLGVPSEQIAWIDPLFQVGDLGAQWQSISSNTKVDLFVKFLLGYKAFQYAQCETSYPLHQLDPNQTCLLKFVVEPLLWVTKRLQSQVQVIQSTVLQLKMEQRHWQLTLQEGQIQSKNVVLAIGAEPRVMPSTVPVIPLADALHKDRLPLAVNEQDTVAVFGTSHSAIIVIRLLLESNVKKIINFYRGPLRYAVYLDDFILFDNTGLKGETAAWAREHIDGKISDRLTRVWLDETNTAAYLPQCTKSIQAIGFNRRALPIEGLPVINYNDKSGIIAPGLFGCGIAFPESTIDAFANVESSVGLWKFMHYLNRVVPVWQKYEP
ncbi:MAG: pyridine nucleotide-disulfide oxidoreductase [Legionellaceae bacterium]|nr:pyridine nucleotide-disulfide oxidoreductase [Legionellaceae bacterium]